MARVGICAKCGQSAKLRKMRLSDEYLCKKCVRKWTRERRSRQFDTYETSKKAYERRELRHRAKQLPDFDTLFELFSSDCTSFTEIGEQFGHTKGRVSQIYQKYFAKLIPRRPDGLTRQKVCTRKRRFSLAVSMFRSMPCFTPLIQEAERHGVKAESILWKMQPRYHHPKISNKRVRLNRHVCLLLLSKKKRIHNRLYWTFHPRNPQRAEFLILQAAQEGTERYRFFVLPSQLISASQTISIPVNGWSMYRNKGPAINWFEYENRWDLLLGRQPKPIALAPLAPPSASLDS